MHLLKGKQMEKNHYVRTTKAWYWRENQIERKWVDEVYFYTDDPWGEMAMRWHDIGGEIAPRLEVYIQSAYALSSLSGLITDLGRVSKDKEDDQFSPEKFCQLLEHNGFVDKTPYRYEDSYPNEQS